MAASNINTSTLVELSELIEKLTTSGRPTLDERTAKQLKKICRTSDGYVKQAYGLTMAQLRKEHAEIRLSAAQVVNELFLRSHCYRELLLANFQHFMELTLETDLKKPLPAPIRVAKELKKQCVQFVHKWFTKFGDAYKQLALGYNFLTNCKKIDFANIHAQTLAEARREEERRVRQEVRHRFRANAALDEMTDMAAEIRFCLTQAENCMNLLVPDPEAFDVLERSSINCCNDEEALLASFSTGAKCDDISEKDEKKMSNNHDTKEETFPSGISDSNVKKSDDEAIISLLPSSAVKDSQVTKVNEERPLQNHSQSSLEDEKESNKNKEYSDQTEEAKDNKEITDEENADEDKADEDKVDEEKADEEKADEENADEDKADEENADEEKGGEEKAGEEKADEEKVDEESADEENADEEKADEENASRIHGILNYKTSINISMNPKSIAIQETTDNEDLFVMLGDQVALASNKLLPLVKKWLDAFTKAGQNEAHMRSALDFKVDLENMLKKASKLNVVRQKQLATVTNEEGDSEDDDDNDFEEVPEKEGYEPYILDNLREEYGLSPRPAAKPSTSAEGNFFKHKINYMDSEDPTTWAATMKRRKEEFDKKMRDTAEISEQDSDEPQPSTSKDDPSARKNREELLKRAPVIPFGADLYHWGDEFEAPLMVRNDSESRRWWSKHDAEDKVDDLALAAIKRRTIHFIGKFEPVRWHCRAPLANGKLCVRMDRYKCPFHGKILPRDKEGAPNGPEKTETETTDIFEQKSNGWDDPELQADIFAATGIDLSLKKKRKGKGKNRERKYPNLTDIKSLTKNTARKRLEAKVLSSSSIKRVAQSMNELDDKRYKEKFGNNFNYSCQL